MHSASWRRRWSWAAIVLGVLFAVVAARGLVQSSEDVASESTTLASVLDIRPGMTVAEIGAGGGEFTVAIAQRLGPTGLMFSTELDRHRLEDIKRAVDRAGLHNVKVIEAAEATTELPSACCDAIFMRRVYHHLTHPSQIDASLFGALRPGGLLAVVDFEPRGGSIPPGVPANRGGDGVRPGIVMDEVTAAGFAYVRTIRDWSENMYLVLFRKP
jgi:predicted methyltransferase